MSLEDKPTSITGVEMITDSRPSWLRRTAAVLAGRSAAAMWGRAAAALMCLAALAACSSSSSSGTTQGSPNTSPVSSAASTAPATAPAQSTSPPLAANPACANGSLQVKLGPGQGYAGGVDE